MNIITILLVVYLMLCLTLYVAQRKLLYIPSHDLLTPEHYGIKNIHAITFSTEDGITLTSWFKKPETDEPVILYFHGNAGHLGDRSEKYQRFADAGFGLLALSYRGYGTSQGKPSEKGLYHDARAAINYLASQNIPSKQIILYGESLGSGVAVQMATEYDIRAIVLEAPYTSVANRAQELYPYVPAKWLLKDKFNSIKKIKQVNAPLLIFHGKMDNVIPFRHGMTLFDAANTPKEKITFDHTGHTDFDSHTLIKHIGMFLDSHPATKNKNDQRTE